MKKLHLILFGAAMAGMHPAYALINDGKFGDPGELFISVLDEAGQKSYYKDLGVSMTDFLAGKGCFAGDLAADANFAPFIGKPGLVYNIAAVNSLVKDAANNPVNIETWGYLATSSQGAQIFNASWNAIDNAKQKIQAYIGNLNVAPFDNAAGQAAQNISGIFGSTDPGYHGNPTWGSSMGRAVSGSTEGTADQALEFFFVNNTTGSDAGKQVARLGAWTLSGAGKLSYSGTGTATVCAGSGGGSTNKAPVAAVAASQLTADPDTLVTLDGSPSSDPDGGPRALSYSWRQTSTPAVALAGANQAKASFTPTQSGTYTFELTVSDGQDSSKANVTVTVKTVVPTPKITLNTPTIWKKAKKQTIAWTTVLVDAKQKVTIQFSKNGGRKFRKLGAPANKKGAFVWKPAARDVTTQGVLKLCVAPTKKVKTPVCTQTNITVLKK
jgi:hypothetical protein